MYFHFFQFKELFDRRRSDLCMTANKNLVHFDHSQRRNVKQQNNMFCKGRETFIININ